MVFGISNADVDSFLDKETLSNTKETPGFKDTVAYSADGRGLPYSKVPNNHAGKITRNVISWYIPEFGIIKMFVNPASIQYTDKKLVTEDKTKGGYTFQYWGEDLTRIQITGTTGSSGIEGINMLHEMYRAEQYAFDSVGLTLAAASAASDLGSKIVGGTGDYISGSTDSALGGVMNGLFGTESPNNNLGPKSIMTLAQLAFGIEMYDRGWVYRGYFTNMTFTEHADNFLIDYSIGFTATQRRGYRFNSQPWNRSPGNGPSQYDTPYSFNGNKIT